MTRVTDICALVLLRADFLGGNSVGSCNLVNYALNGNLGRNIVVENIRNNLLNGRDSYLFIIKKRFSLEFFYCSLKLSDI